MVAEIEKLIILIRLHLVRYNTHAFVVLHSTYVYCLMVNYKEFS